MSTPVKHPRTFQRPQHPQPPGPTANHNSGCAHLQDHPESGRLYKLASSSIQQDSTTRSRWDNFSGSNLPSSALQRSHRDYFSGSPSGPSNKPDLLTGPYREVRIAGGPRSGPAQTHPRAALPDVHLEIGAALPEAAATSCAEYPPLVLNWNGWSSPAAQNRPADKDPGLPGATTNGPGTALPLRRPGQGSDPLTPADGANDCPTLLKHEKSWQALFPAPHIVGKGRPDYSPDSPWKLAHRKGIPGLPTLIVLCDIPSLAE